MMEGVKAHFAKRLLRQLIDIATQALYSEQFEMEPLVTRLSRGQSGVALLRSYVSIQTAARLTEPLSDAEMDRALNAVQRCEAYAELPVLRQMIDVHRELAEHYWSLQHLEIIRGKLAFQNDESSYEGTLYNLRHTKKCPVSKAECAKFAPICKQLSDLNRQVEQAELKAWKEQDKEEYERYKEELAARDLSAEADAVETESIRLESAGVVTMLEAKLNALLQQAITSEFTQDPDTICSFGQMAFDGDGVDQNYVEAANWYKMAAEKGHARAQHNLALMYENGQGVTRDLAEAAKWYRMAAEQGNAGSQNNLATLYESGVGVPQDDTIALDLYRLAAKGGDENAASNAKRLEAVLKGPVDHRKRYEKMVFAFSDLMAAHSPLIGDCSLLPYPKGTLLYAIRWVMDEYETNREATGNEELRQAYDKMLPTLSYLFTRLARDWQEIDPADKDSIAKLRDCESFPEWALQYKRKYIDDERASNEAAEVAFQVMKDRIAQEKSEA
jgi:hypothetical protein